MRLRQVAAALAGAVVITGMLASNALAQRFDRDRDGRRGGLNPEWVLLGEKSVGFRVDRDVINIGHGEDWYRERRFSTPEPVILSTPCTPYSLAIAKIAGSWALGALTLALIVGLAAE